MKINCCRRSQSPKRALILLLLFVLSSAVLDASAFAQPPTQAPPDPTPPSQQPVEDVSEATTDLRGPASQASFQTLLEQFDRLKGSVQLGSLSLYPSQQIGQTLANRVAAAEIDNRLRLAEHRATVKALQDNRAKIEKYAREEARLALSKASLVLEQREIDLRELQRTLSLTKGRTERERMVDEVDRQKLFVREAELIKREAELQLTFATREVDRRLLEATMQVQIGETLKKTLEEERARVEKQLDLEMQWLSVLSQLQLAPPAAVPDQAAAGEVRKVDVGER